MGQAPLAANRLLAVAVLAFCAAACSGHKRDAASLSEVKQALSAAGLKPQEVKLTVTVHVAKPGDPPPGQVNYCAAEAVAQPSATSLGVAAGAIVMVFKSRREANAWKPRPECGTTPFRIANVIAVPTHGSLSRRLRVALRQAVG